MKGLSFSEPMVKAWMEGRKSVTRRLMNPQPEYSNTFKIPIRNGKEIKARYLPGETVYIKETWRETWCSGSQDRGYQVGIEYKAKLAMDDYGKTAKVPEMHYGYNVTKKGNPAWKSPRFMPEWASRSHARIVSVKPERVQEITEEEAIKEGTTPSIVGAELDYLRYRAGFQTLWETLHPGTWDRNPWVWRIELEKLP